MDQVKKLKINCPSTEDNCADKLCEPVYKKFKSSQRDINYHEENKKNFCFDQSDIFIKDVRHPNLPKYVTKYSSDALGINFERQIENKHNLSSLTSIIESAFGVFQNAHFILSQQVFSPLPRIHVPYSDILKYFGIGNNPNHRAATFNEIVESMLLERNQETEEIKSKFVFNSNEELNVEWSDALLTYNPLKDNWPSSLSPLEFSMVPSVGIHDSRNWDVIDNLSLDKAKKNNHLNCEVSTDNRKSSFINSVSFNNNPARFDPHISLLNTQCSDNICNEPAIQNGPCDMIYFGTNTRSDKTINLPLDLKNSLSKTKNGRQEKCNDVYSYDLVKKNEIGHLNETVQEVAQFKQMDHDSTISEYETFPKTCCLVEKMSNLPSNNVVPALERNTSKNLTGYIKAHDTVKIGKKPDCEVMKIENIFTPSTPEQSSKSKALSYHLGSSHMINPCSMMTMNLELNYNCSMTNSEQNKLPFQENSLVAHSLNSLDVCAAHDSPKPFPVHKKSVIQTNSIASQNLIPNSLNSASISAVDNCSKPTSKLEKTTVRSYLPSLENLNFSSTKFKKVIISENSEITVPEQNKSILQSNSSYSLSPDPHSTTLADVSNSNKTQIRKILHKTQNCCRKNKNITKNYKSSELGKIGKEFEHEPMKVNMPIPKQTDKLKALPCKLRTLQRLNPETITSTSLGLTNNCSATYSVQNKLKWYPLISASQNFKPHNIDLTSKGDANNCSIPSFEQHKTNLNSCPHISQMDSVNVSTANNCSKPIFDQDKLKLKSRLCAMQNLNAQILSSASDISVDNNGVATSIPDRNKLILHTDKHTLQKLNLPTLESTDANVLTKCAKSIPEQGKSLCLSSSQSYDPHSIYSSASSSTGKNLCQMAEVVNSIEASIKSDSEKVNIDATLPITENIFSLNSTEKSTKEGTISSRNANENIKGSLIGPFTNKTTNMPYFLLVPKIFLAPLKVTNSNEMMINS